MDIPVVELTELEKLEVTRVDAVSRPANGFPVLLMKGLEKDWADWDAAHEGGGKGKPSAAGDSKASAASAVARAKQTIADHKAGKPVSAADLKNAHEVHEAHLAHEAKLKADAEAKGKAKGTAKPKAKNPKAAKSIAAIIANAPGIKWDLAKLLKAVGADGEVDEEPDVEGGTRVLEMIADLIIAEAQELKAGQAGEIADIFELCCAAEKIWCWRTGEQAVSSGSVMPATALMQSAAVAKDREYSAAERKEMAGDGRALPDGSYPIADEHDLNSAAILARSGHGDVTAATRHIGKRAKDLGVKNPLDDTGDTSKSQIAEGGTDVDTETQTGDLTEVVKAADAKAAALEKRVTDQESVIKALEGRLAKVEAAPVPGGPVMSVVRPKTAADGEDHAAVAKRYEEWADVIASPQDADHYRQLAAQERAKITS